MHARAVSPLLSVTVAVATTLVSTVAPAAATPVATTPEEREAQGRTFLEPIESTDFVQFGANGSTPEFADGMALLEQLFPDLIEVTTIEEELGDPNAVSVGDDGVPAWDADDTGDGWPFHVVTVTDETVPDDDKQYVLVMVAHSAEWCGRETIIRYIEDLLIAATEAPGTVLTDADGNTGVEHQITVAELLERTKLFYVSTSPDGWASGDGGLFNRYGQFNGAGINNNRVAHQDGWVFPAEPEFADNGYAVLSEPEGAAVVEYLSNVRHDELDGRPFAAQIDFHGPAPVGALLFMDQGNTPAKLQRIADLAQRIKEKNDGVLADYITQQGLEAHQLAASNADELRLFLLDTYAQNVGPVPDNAAYLTFSWAEYGTPWEHINYTVSGSYSGWSNSHAGLDADALAYENPCETVTGGWYAPAMQLYVDNLRAALDAIMVRSAFRDTDEGERIDLTGRVGFFDHGRRVTDADGNPSPPPDGYPGTPLVPQVTQRPYDVANTDYFRDLRELVSSDIVEVGSDELGATLPSLSSFVVSDAPDVDVDELRDFATTGGNLVLTDAAVQLAEALLDLGDDAAVQHRSYVGYADLDVEHPLAEDLYPRARQLFDPVGIGYPLMMARDNYWPDSETSPTENSAPLWTLDRSAWEAAGGEVVGTADPPEDPRSTGEGFDTDKVTIGLAPLGEGRLVVFGGLLPQPTEEYPHWFGLNAYTVSIPGQTMLLRALEWSRPGGEAAPRAPAPPAPDSPVPEPAPLPTTGGSGVLLASLALLTAGAAARRRL